MALPPKVQQQLDAANAMLAQQNAADAPAAPQPTEAPEPAPTPDAEPTPVENAPTPAPAPISSADFERLVQQHRSLQGVHRSMQEQIRQREIENARLQAALEEARTQRQDPAPAPSADPKDAEVFGNDLVEMVSRVAEQRTEQRLSAIVKVFESRFTELQNAIMGTSQVVSQTKNDVFLSKLTEAVPDWKAINQDQGFLEWLTEIDDVYGVPRQEALDDASKRQNPERVAKIFLAYKATKAPAVPARPSAQATLEKQIAPNSASNPAPTARARSEWVLIKDVEAFYRDCAHGKYRGREAERAALENTINNALATGRVVDKIPRQPV